MRTVRAKAARGTWVHTQKLTRRHVLITSHTIDKTEEQRGSQRSTGHHSRQNTVTDGTGMQLCDAWYMLPRELPCLTLTCRPAAADSSRLHAATRWQVQHGGEYVAAREQGRQYEVTNAASSIS